MRETDIIKRDSVPSAALFLTMQAPVATDRRETESLVVLPPEAGKVKANPRAIDEGAGAKTAGSIRGVSMARLAAVAYAG